MHVQAELVVKMDSASKPKLFAIASEKYVGPGPLDWKPVINLCHAEDAARAKIIFLSDNNHVRLHRIIAIGEVIGFHVEDEHGEKLRA